MVTGGVSSGAAARRAARRATIRTGAEARPRPTPPSARSPTAGAATPAPPAARPAAGRARPTPATRRAAASRRPARRRRGGAAAPPLRQAGRPLNRHSPFYIGFFGAIGALLAIGLWHTVGRLTTTLTLLVVVDSSWPSRSTRSSRRSSRAGCDAVGAVARRVRRRCSCVFALLGAPRHPAGRRPGQRAGPAGPELPRQRPRQPAGCSDLDKSYDVIDKIQAEFSKRITDSNFLERVLGGVLGAGRAVLTASSRSSPCSC